MIEFRGKKNKQYNNGFLNKKKIQNQKMKIIKLFAIIATTTLISCGGEEDSSTTRPTPTPDAKATTLKAAATFPIGNIVSASRLSGSDVNFTTLLNKEFNSITAENDMKMGAMFTGSNTYDFSKGDAIVAYAKANGLRVHGHALVWHASIPSWLKNFTGTDAEFEAQVKGYIKATVAHFSLAKTTDGKPVVASWDVVNEAFTSEALAGPFYAKLGPDYVAKCFSWAKEANADVKLFYNDYNLDSQASKVTSVVDMLADFKKRAIPIDGIGSQMHIGYSYPDLTTIKNNLSPLVGTGLLIHFSELDMSVNRDLVLTSFSTERSNAQKEKYKSIAALYKTIPAAQRFGITFWGVRDNDSWLRGWPVKTDYEWPLLFDSNYGYKPAYTGFFEGLK